MLDLAAEAELLLAQGSIEQACAPWGRAMDHMDGVASARTRRTITHAARPVPLRARGLRCAQQLDERAINLLHA
ncbi:hypothetical protein AB0J71_46290 [Nonomuraea sp. NPDC049637]|uniref:hypothetical protein n=1 Tax=Nonomuraea sp. NPDC049637 TaxID=3154356 RepID=UPI00341D7DEA